MTERTIQERLRASCFFKDYHCDACEMRKEVANHIDAIEAEREKLRGDYNEATNNWQRAKEQVEQLKDEVLRKQHTIQSVTDAKQELKWQVEEFKRNLKVCEGELVHEKSERIRSEKLIGELRNELASVKGFDNGSFDMLKRIAGLLDCGAFHSIPFAIEKLKCEKADALADCEELADEKRKLEKELHDGGDADFRTIKEVTAENVSLKKKVQELHNEKCGLVQERDMWKGVVAEKDTELVKLRSEKGGLQTSYDMLSLLHRKLQDDCESKRVKILELEGTLAKLQDYGKRSEENNIVLGCNARFEADLKKQRDEQAKTNQMLEDETKESKALRDLLRTAEHKLKCVEKERDNARRERDEAKQELSEHPKFKHLNARNKALARNVKGMRKHARDTGAWFGKTLAREQELWEKKTADLREQIDKLEYKIATESCHNRTQESFADAINNTEKEILREELRKAEEEVHNWKLAHETLQAFRGQDQATIHKLRTAITSFIEVGKKYGKCYDLECAMDGLREAIK